MKKLSSAVTMFVVAALLISALGVFKPVYAQTTFYMTPAANNYTTNTATIGTTFDVTFWATDYANIGAWQIYLEFNDAILQVTKWVEPTADAQYIFHGETTSANPVPPDAGYVHLAPNKGRVQFAANLFPTPPTQPAASGALAKLAVLTFKIIALPDKLGSLSCALHWNNPSTFLLDADGNTVNPTITDGSYSIVWAAPAAPGLGFDQTLYEKTQGTHWIGTTFPVKVSLTGLSAAWFLTGASFSVTWDDTTVISLDSVVVDALWTVSSVLPAPPQNTGAVSISVSAPSSNPSGDVLVCTLNFMILKQGNNPPQTTPDVAHLTIANAFFEDHVGPIPTGTLGTATVQIDPYLVLHLPWLAVVPTHTTMGPNPVIGETFSVDIYITGASPLYLEEGWHVVGVQFRLFYDPTLIEPVDIALGPFFQNPTWDLHGVFFYGSFETDGLGPHVLVGELLLPNGVGDYDQTVYPNGQGSVATITFKVLTQECPDPFVSPLTLDSVFGQYLIDRDGNYVPYLPPVNGDVTILPFDTPGRMIDLTGGAVNDGYGVLIGAPYLQFPAPYGGQGPNHWMDIVFPQSWVYLNAYLTYNYWPIQSKQVGFEIEGPFTKLWNGTLVPSQRYSILAKFAATTGTDGNVSIGFRMPWPCEDPDGITGIYKVTATATVADQVINDTMIFYYQRLGYLNGPSGTITGVTTDKFYYTHEECVKVTVEYTTHSVEYYPALFSVVITDDLGVPIGMAIVNKQIGGATFCQWKNSSFTVEICIPKYAYAGYAHVHVNLFDKDPTEGGEAITPEYTPAPEIQIGPY